jgi:aminoglycoside phosphotransferase (APT) family kinase protein
MRYDALPAQLRTFVDEHCGPVVAVTDHPTGFSPGVAATVRTGDGTAHFVKAVTADVNLRTRDMHRREADNLRALSATRAAPQLLATYDESPWILLVTEHVPGAMPDLPWTSGDLRSLVGAVDGLAALAAPPTLPTLAEEFAGAFTGWRALASGACVPVYLPSDLVSRIDDLASMEPDWVAAAAGDQLIHGDIRGDNLLVDNGHARLVDWPFACRGNPALDAVAAAGAIAMQGGPEPAEFVLSTAAGRACDSDALRALTVAAVGYLVNAGRQPPPPGLPTLREFQRAQAQHFYGWLRQLL